MSTSDHEGLLLASTELVRLKVRYTFELQIASFNEFGMATMSPNEAAELSGLVIGMGSSPASLAHMEAAGKNVMGCKHRIDAMMAAIVARVEMAANIRCEREASIYASHFDRSRA
jgi:hypothetical protein